MNSPLIFTDPSGLQVAQRFCNNCQPAIRGTGKNETLGVFEKGAKLPKGFKPITERREFHGESNRSYWLTATTVLPYDPKTKAKQIVDDGVKFINSGHGLPSESSERQNLIKDRIICMVGSSGCSQTFKDAGIPTTEEVILQRGITIADPLILKSPESVNLIGDGFTEEARQSGVEYLNDGGWIFRGSDAFSLVPDDYESNPSQRAFTFFKEQAFKLDGWFGGGQPTRLNEAVPHEMTHDSNVPVYPRPPLTFFYNDLTGYPYYENILKNCMCPEENN